MVSHTCEYIETDGTTAGVCHLPGEHGGRSVGNPEAPGRGTLLRLPEIAGKTGLAQGTIRSKYHGGTMSCVWKLGRRLVAWEADLDAWLVFEQDKTTKNAAIGPYESLVTECPDLAALARLVARETAIRSAMDETGEDRQTIVDMVAAADSMDQEAILALTDGAPTTLRDALATYADGLSKQPDDETARADQVFNDITALLEYPYPGQLHLEIENPEDNEDFLEIRVNGRTLFEANHDDHGRDGMRAAREVAQAVFDAVAP